MQEFIELVKRRIKETKMPLTELAEVTKMSRSHIYRIMSGDVMPTLDTADKIARALDLKITTSQN